MLVAVDELLESPAVAAAGAPYERSVRIFHVVKILLWHGYLLGGTGSNVYTRSLARAWAVSDMRSSSSARTRIPTATNLGGAGHSTRDRRAHCRFSSSTATRISSRPILQDLTRRAATRFVELNAAAVREHLPADFLLINHVLLGAPVGAEVGMPYTVKAHGSELEFSIRGNDRSRPPGRVARSTRRRRSSSARSTSAMCSRRSSAG